LAREAAVVPVARLLPALTSFEGGFARRVEVRVVRALAFSLPSAAVRVVRVVRRVWIKKRYREYNQVDWAPT
jgi:hypothetical protein